MLRDALLQNLGVRDEDVVTDQLDPVAERARQQLPSRPVRFAEAVFDRDDRILLNPFGIHLHHLFRRARRLPGLLEDVLPVVPEFAGRDVECEKHVAAGA